MANIEELVYNYHNLAGTLMKDKKKSLKNFLSDVQSKITSEDELNALISAIRTENDREESFMVDVLVHFKKYEQLMSILKQSENPILIGKILKCWKFFEEFFKNISPAELVNDLFPNTSYSTRMKIINRLSKNLKDEKSVDEYFKAIEEKYGLRVATVLLPACSKDLIETRVTKYDIKLTTRQLMQIVKKRTDFLIFYFDFVCKTDKNFNFSTKYAQIIKYVAKYDVELFWTLRDQYKLDIKFGRHTTTAMLENKKELVTHHEKCANFSKKEIYKIITKSDEDFKQFFLSFYPDNAGAFHYSCLSQKAPLMSFLKYTNGTKRYVLLNDCYKIMYGKNLHDDRECATEDSLSIMPQSIREDILEEKVIEEEDLIYMFNAKKALSAIKDRIIHTSDIPKRNKYVSLMYKTCKFNKDDSALLDVLKYLFHRHKNDTYILNSFMRKLIYWPDLEKLSDEHWTLINDFLKFLEISNVSNTYCDLKKIEYLEKYFVHLYESNQPTEEHMRAFFEYVVATQYSINVFNNNRKYQKMCLERFIELVQLTLEGVQLNDVSKRCLVAIMVYNEANTGDQIPILNYNDMLTFTEIDIKYDNNAQVMIKYCIKRELDGYDSIFWQNYKVLFDYTMVLWYAKKNPCRIIENLHQILENNLPEKILDVVIFALDGIFPNSIIQSELLKLLNESIQIGDFKKASVAIRGLSHVSNSCDFFNHVESLYPPPDGKIDAKEIDKKVLLQERIVKSLVNLKNPSETLTTLLKFCKGDYLKYALGPLYGITSRTRENNLPAFLDALFNSAVSVRKHVVMLTKVLLPQQAIYLCLKQRGSKEKHPSIKRAILKKTLEYFIQNPSELFWTLLCTNMDVISDKDRNAHKCLLDKTKQIPMQYLSRYIQIIYEKFSKNSDKVIEIKKYALITFIPDEIIQKLDVDFLKVLIKDTLFNTTFAQQSNFGFKCIFRHSGAAQMILFEFAFEIFKKFIEKNWSAFVYGETRRTASNFVTTFCLNSINLKAGKKIIEECIARWSLMFKPEEVIDQYLLLVLTAAYFECDFENFYAEFGPKANAILADMVNRYDSTVTSIYSQVLRKFAAEFLSVTKTTEKLHLFMEGFMSVNPTRQTCIVVCHLLKGCRYGDEYGKIIERIQQFEDPVVDIHYKSLLTSWS